MRGGTFTGLLLGAMSGLCAGYYQLDSQHSNGSIRVKSFHGNETELCNSAHPHHAGWADLENGHHLFYWLHEARHDPESAPLLVWLQGGPGASSMFGFLFEHGPCLVNSTESTKYNPYSWTEAFNVVYIDSPAGDTGFSYHDDTSPSHNTTDGVAKEIVTTIGLLYEAFPHLSTVPLHVAGESYGGHWIPAVGAAIVAQNKEKQPHVQPIPLHSLIVGNGWVNPVVQTRSLFDVSCHIYYGFEAYLTHDECEKMLPYVEPCIAALRECDAARDTNKCVATVPLCNDPILEVVLDNRGSSPYDRRLHGCHGDCYQERYATIRKYLGRREILVDHLDLLNASSGRKEKWVPQDMDAPNRHTESGDMFLSVIPQLERVLAEPGIDLLFYSGNADVSCNPKGVLETLETAKWKNQVSLIRAEWEHLSWKTIGGSGSGRAKRVDRLWVVDINEAGHYVPVDQPVVSLNLIKDWLAYTGRDGSQKLNVQKPVQAFGEL